MATKSALNPTYQALYDAELPQLELAARQAAQARGMFYSGQAAELETKAKADLMAKLLSQQASDTQQTKLQQAQINQAQSAQENATKASDRATNMGLIGSGLGAATTLGGLAYMNRGGANGLQNIVAGGPTGYMKLVNGQMTPVPVAGGAVGGAALAPGMGASPTSLSNLPGTGPGFDQPMGPNPTTMAANNTPTAVPSAGAVTPAAPESSMWSNPLSELGAGLAGGLGGYLAANRVNGGGRNTALASGLGGLAGAAFGASGIGSSWGAGNPYAAGAGALLGSFGGGLLGNLFK